MRFSSKLNQYEAVCVIVTLLCSKLFISYPLYKESFSGFEIIIINFISFFFLWLWALISSKINLKVAKPVKNTLLLLLIFATLVIASLSFAKYTVSLKWSLLNNSPQGFIALIILAGVLFGVFTGIKGISKLCSFFTPFILVFTVIFLYLASKSFDLYKMFPVLGDSFGVILKHSFFMLSSLWEFVFVSFLPSLLKRQEKLNVTITLSLVISFLFYSLVGTGIILSSVSGGKGFPEIFKIIRLIDPLSVIERPDSVFYILYVLSVLLYISLLAFFAKEIYTKISNIRYDQELVVPACLIISALSFSSISDFELDMWYSGALSSLFVLILIIPVIFQRKKKGS